MLGITPEILETEQTVGMYTESSAKFPTLAQNATQPTPRLNNRGTTALLGSN